MKKRRERKEKVKMKLRRERRKDRESEDEAEERKDGEGEDEEEEKKDGEDEDEEEEGGWNPSIDGIDGSQIWFSDDEADYNEEVNEENDDEGHRQ
jgi:hypothetical protein